MLENTLNYCMYLLLLSNVAVGVAVLFLPSKFALHQRGGRGERDVHPLSQHRVGGIITRNIGLI